MNINCLPQEVEREVASMAQAGDVTLRPSHVELAILHLTASGAIADDPKRCRQVVETAVFTRIAFNV